MTYGNDKPHFLFEGVTQDLRLYVYVLPGTQRHSQLEAKLSTFVQGNPCLMLLSSLLWVFLAFIFSGRDAPKHGCACSGWKACTQARGASRGLGEGRRTGEKQALHDFRLFWGVVVLNEPNSYIILFTVSPLFSDFPTGSSVAQKVIQDPPDIPSRVGESVTLNCRCETSWRSFNILWYKHLPSGEMIFLTRDGQYSINFDRLSKSSSLTISTLQLEDSAKYFCVLWELTVLEVIGKAEQKPPSLIRESLSAVGPRLKYTPADPRQ